MSSFNRTKDEILSILGYFTAIPFIPKPETFGFGLNIYTIFPIVHLSKAAYASILPLLIYLTTSKEFGHELAILISLVMFSIIFHYSSGGIHHDGYIDTIDGSLAGASLSGAPIDLKESREKTMRVMKEPTVGAIGSFMLISTMTLTTVMAVTAMYISGENLAQLLLIESIIYLSPSLIIANSLDRDLAKDLPEKSGDPINFILGLATISAILMIILHSDIIEILKMWTAAFLALKISSWLTIEKARNFKMTINGDVLGYSIVLGHLIYPITYIILK